MPENRAYKNRLPGPLARRAGQLFDEAVKLGAFGGPEHEELRELLDRAHHFSPDKWEDIVWMEAVNYLCPALSKTLGPVGSIVPACERIADVIEAQAAKLEESEPEGAPKGRKKRKRRRYKTENDPEKDVQLVKDWQAAKASGTRKIEDFCRDRGLNEEEFRAAYERHRHRK